MFSLYIKKFNQDGEIYLRIKVLPGMPETKLRLIMADETIKINIAAPPAKGKANLELIKFLAREFAINKNNVKIISGAGDRVKLVKIVK